LFPYTDQPFLTPGSMLKIMPDVIRLQAFLGTYCTSRATSRRSLPAARLFLPPLLIGGNPFDTPSIYTLIVQFEKEWGVHYAKGGTGAIVDALGRLFAELGGTSHFNTEVGDLVDGRRVTGVRLADGTDIRPMSWSATATWPSPTAT
jgi:phytoene desaturase